MNLPMTATEVKASELSRSIPENLTERYEKASRDFFKSLIDKVESIMKRNGLL